MKTFGRINAIILLTAMLFMFAACVGNIDGNIDVEKPAELDATAAAEGAAETSVVSETVSFPESEPFMRLYSAGIEIPTQEFFFNSSTAYYENGVPKGLLHGDGNAFFDPDHIESAYDGLPVYSGCRVEGLDIRLSEGSKIAYIYLYDPANGFERTTLNTMSELDKIIIGSAVDGREYVVEVIVFHEGDFIEELSETESETNSYAFIVR